MSHLYLMRSDIKLGYSQGQVVVTDYADNSTRKIPFATVEGISVFGQAQLTTQLIRECIANDVTIMYYSDDGHYFGRVDSFDRIDPSRHKLQMYASDDESFCLEISKRIIDAKIRNSITLLSFFSAIYEFGDSDFAPLEHAIAGLPGCCSRDEIMGFEGSAAKAYFRSLSKVLVREFEFSGRSARPPRDPFNSMLSFSYSIFFVTLLVRLSDMDSIPILPFCTALSSATLL